MLTEVFRIIRTLDNLKFPIFTEIHSVNFLSEVPISKSSLEKATPIIFLKNKASFS